MWTLHLHLHVHRTIWNTHHVNKAPSYHVPPQLFRCASPHPTQGKSSCCKKLPGERCQVPKSNAAAVLRVEGQMSIRDETHVLDICFNICRSPSVHEPDVIYDFPMNCRTCHQIVAITLVFCSLHGIPYAVILPVRSASRTWHTMCSRCNIHDASTASHWCFVPSLDGVLQTSIGWFCFNVTSYHSKNHVEFGISLSWVFFV